MPTSPPRSLPRWSWFRQLDWLDEITVPHWAPEGNPSCALLCANSREIPRVRVLR